MPPNNNSVWDRPGVLDEARSLANSGKTSGRIAEALSAKFGLSISRNAVVGKLSRLNIQLFGAKTIKPKIAARPPIAKIKKAKPIPVPRMTDRRTKTREALPEPIPMGDVDHGCRWITGEGSSRNFCGAPKVQLSSWCSHHLQRCFQSNSSWLDMRHKRAA